MLSLIRLVQEEPSFLRGLVTDIPHDPGAIFVYLLIMGSIGLVWMGNRKKKV